VGGIDALIHNKNVNDDPQRSGYEIEINKVIGQKYLEIEKHRNLQNYEQYRQEETIDEKA
jgi:hypothetical protein